MPATDELHEALFQKFKKLRDDDSGAGGLANTTGNQYVPEFIAAWDVKATGSPQQVRIVFEVVDDTDGSSFGFESPDCTIRMHLFTPQDPGSARERAIMLRMNTIFKAVNLSTSYGYVGGRVKWRRAPRAPTAFGNMLHRVIECTCKLTID